MSLIREMADSSFKLGHGALADGRLREAAFLFGKALHLEPGRVDTVLALGHCLYQQGFYKEALAVYDRFLAAFPVHAAVVNNRATALLALCRYEEAVLCYQQVLTLQPEWHDSRVALATCWQALGRIDLAEAACDQVLAEVPGHAEAHWNRALLLLLTGRYEEGWREYEWRWQKRGFTSPGRNFLQPLWQGEPLAGKTILVHAEQGFGDTLQFCRYLPQVVACGGRVVFECQPPLTALLAASFPDVTCVAMGDPLPHFDVQIPLLSLAGLFATTLAMIPADVPYLGAPDDRTEPCLSLPDAEGHLKVGLCWAGKSYPDPLRSCPVEQLAPLADLTGVAWYSLQVGWDKPLPFAMTDYTGQLHDFADTAALLARLDLVITIDTAVAHLAGALGKPTLVMLPSAADWRWLVGREDSPWYPTIKLIRQRRAGDWGEVIDKTSAQLLSLI